MVCGNYDFCMSDLKGYEGLWIGGSRKNKSDGWHWTSEQKMEDSVLSNSMVYENYPAWYTVSEETVAEQNCLLFNRIGHDVPVFIPEKCNLPRPFICMRDGIYIIDDLL